MKNVIIKKFFILLCILFAGCSFSDKNPSKEALNMRAYLYELNFDIYDDIIFTGNPDNWKAREPSKVEIALFSEEEFKKILSAISKNEKNKLIQCWDEYVLNDDYVNLTSNHTIELKLKPTINPDHKFINLFAELKYEQENAIYQNLHKIGILEKHFLVLGAKQSSERIKCFFVSLHFIK